MWGGGSGGHIKPDKCPSVLALDGVKCQISEHNCQGVWHCDKLDMMLLDGCKRYKPDNMEMRELFEAEREINLEEGSTMHILAAAYVFSPIL